MKVLQENTTNSCVDQTKLNFRTESHKEVLSITGNAAAARLKQTFNSFRAVHSGDFQSSQTIFETTGSTICFSQISWFTVQCTSTNKN